jgi:hypothetical protein
VSRFARRHVPALPRFSTIQKCSYFDYFLNAWVGGGVSGRDSEAVCS